MWSSDLLDFALAWESYKAYTHQFRSLDSFVNNLLVISILLGLKIDWISDRLDQWEDDRNVMKSGILKRKFVILCDYMTSSVLEPSSTPTHALHSPQGVKEWRNSPMQPPIINNIFPSAILEYICLHDIKFKHEDTCCRNYSAIQCKFHGSKCFSFTFTENRLGFYNLQMKT